MSLPHLQLGNIEIVTSGIDCSDVQQAAASCVVSLLCIRQRPWTDDTYTTIAAQNSAQNNAYTPCRHHREIQVVPQASMLLNRPWPWLYMSANAPGMRHEIGTWNAS